MQARAQTTFDSPDLTYSTAESELPPLFWVRGEYLLWWLKDQSLPPLVTTSATQASAGRLGLSDTSVLYGGDVDEKVRQGFRITLGSAPFILMNDTCFRLGFEGSFFLLEQSNEGFSAASTGTPVLARPFINALTGQSSAAQVANLLLTNRTGGLALRGVNGRIAISDPSDLRGADLNAALVLGNDDLAQVHMLCGVRYLYLQERLDIREDLFEPANAAAGIRETMFGVEDRFRTRNEFLGGQLGLRSTARLGDFTLEWQGKVALGSTHQSVLIEGATTTTVAGGTPVSSTGGLLALPTNIGLYTRDRFTIVPELALNLGYQLTPCLRGFIGYNFLWWSTVVRPGPQIDASVNPNVLPPAAATQAGPARPAFRGVGSDLWVQGLTLGVEFTY
jgi:hypothetical protein